MTISSPGSYFFAGTITVSTTGNHGITIISDNVTIDLNGFSLIGPGKEAGTTDNGIDVNTGLKNVTVKNGTIRDWPHDGAFAYYASFCVFESLQCLNNGRTGIYGCNEMTARNNICNNNGSLGISAGHHSRLTGNVCKENGFRGLGVGYGSVVTGNSCNKNSSSGMDIMSGSTAIGNSRFDNGGNGISLWNNVVVVNNACASNGSSGIFASGYGSGCTIINNSCSENGSYGIYITGAGGSTISGNSCIKNGACGIYTRNGVTISGNTCKRNTSNGIEAWNANRIVNNTCDENGYQLADGAGIVVGGADNRIEGNTVTNNDRGIEVQVAGNFIVQNSASGNSTNFSIAETQTIGPIITATGTITTTNPWANFSF